MPTLKMSKTLSVMCWYRNRDGTPIGASQRMAHPGSISPPQAAQLPAFVLIRALLRPWSQCVRDLHPRREIRTPRLAGGGFFITPYRLGSRPPPRRNRRYRALEFNRPAYENNGVAGPHRARGFHALAVQMHLAPAHRLRGQRARLEQPHEKQPLVDSGVLRRAVGIPLVRVSGSLIHGVASII